MGKTSENIAAHAAVILEAADAKI